MTFEINGVDCSEMVTAYGYETVYEPVYTNSVRTMDGVEHVKILRYRGGLSVTLKPLTGPQLQTIVAALGAGVPMIRYFCLQRNTNVLAQMKLDQISSELVLKNASRMLYGNTRLNFTEL